ncbi:MAG: hypothetical protein GX663_08395 [Clostridiales bacterium]|nr:hypothetical protein [Clostridiales bacterium]
MKAVVIYNSKTGFTEKYAKWIAEELGCKAQSIDKTKEADIVPCDCVIYGGWLMASGINGLKRLKKMRALNGKRVFVFAVGVSDMDMPGLHDKIVEMNFSPEERLMAPVFYFEGGINYEKMGFMSKKMLGMLKKNVGKKEVISAEESNLLDKISRDYDGTKREYIEPLIEIVKETCER